MARFPSVLTKVPLGPTHRVILSTPMSLRFCEPFESLPLSIGFGCGSLGLVFDLIGSVVLFTSALLCWLLPLCCLDCCCVGARLCCCCCHCCYVCCCDTYVLLLWYVCCCLHRFSPVWFDLASMSVLDFSIMLQTIFVVCWQFTSLYCCSCCVSVCFVALLQSILGVFGIGWLLVNHGQLSWSSPQQ